MSAFVVTADVAINHRYVHLVGAVDFISDTSLVDALSREHADAVVFQSYGTSTTD
jgi:hypothetical protein